jgi:hypothetical protein
MNQDAAQGQLLDDSQGGAPTRMNVVMDAVEGCE